MGVRIDLTLFVAADPDLDACFPAWRRPLPEPRAVEQINPFTRETDALLTWDPGRPPGAGPPRSLWSARRRKAVDPILPPENDEDRWLQEHDAPALLRTLPHFAMGGVSFRPLSELLAALDLPGSPPARFFVGPGGSPPARFVDCPDDEGTIEALPEAAVGPLAKLGDRESKACLAAWQKALGLKGKSAKLIETEAAEGSAWALRRIRALAAEAVRRGGISSSTNASDGGPRTADERTGRVRPRPFAGRPHTPRSRG